jgi:hypothetical protein
VSVGDEGGLNGEGGRPGHEYQERAENTLPDCPTTWSRQTQALTTIPAQRFTSLQGSGEKEWITPLFVAL